MKKIALLVLLLSLSSLVSAQRLPQNVTPINYQLTFGPDLKAATFTGDEVISVQLAKPSSSITMNSAEIKILEATITSGQQSQPATATYDAKQEQVTLTTAKPIPAGPAKIAIKYTGILNNQLRGFYLSKSKTRNYATTQFENTDARRAFPSFDEPAFKATFDITLIVDKGDTAFSNGRELSDTPGPGADKHTVKFATSAKMSTYLVAMVVGDLVCQKGEVDGIPLRVCSTPEKVQQLGFALDATKHIVHFYNQYYGIKYPFGKLDQLGIPDFSAGAMENTGAITYRETALLIPEIATTNQRKGVASTIAHEIAHQWFGDLVTMKWWDDIWLNEGFATWMSSKPLETWMPEWNFDLDDVQGTQQALGLDALASQRAIHQPANTPEEIAALFDGIAYGKTAAVLRMIEEYVGPENFRKGVNNYLEKHKYGNTEAKDFWTEIATASGKPVDKIMPTFVNQAGGPLITAKAACSAGKTKIDVSQQRFLIDPQLMQKGSSELWQVPVCVKTANSKTPQCTVVTQKQQTISVDGCGPWFFANSGGAGYFRTAYDDANMAKLSANVETALTPGERISFVGDQWALTQNGKQSVATFLNLAQNFKQEKSRAVMEQLLGPISYLHERIITPEERPAFEAWVRNLLQPMLNELGMKPVEGENSDRSVLRSSIMTALGQNGDEQVLAYARGIVDGYMKDPASVPPNQVPFSFAMVSQRGDAALYDQFLEKRKAAKTPTEFYRYQGALSNFRDAALVKRTLDMSLSPEVRSQDLPQVIFGVFGNPAGRDLALDFVKTNYDEIQKRTIASLGGGFGGVVSSFCDPQKRDEAKQFLESKKVGERSLKLGVERSDACINFKNQQSQNLAGWLKTQASGTAGSK